MVRVPRPFEPTQVQPDRPPLLIGSYATVDIEGTTFDQFAIVPAAAVHDDGMVWTVESDTILVMKKIEFVQEIEEVAIVLGALDAGTPVIVTALPFVTDGMTVQVAQPLEMTPNAIVRDLTPTPEEEATSGDGTAETVDDITESHASEDDRR